MKPRTQLDFCSPSGFRPSSQWLDAVALGQSIMTSARPLVNEIEREECFCKSQCHCIRELRRDFLYFKHQNKRKRPGEKLICAAVLCTTLLPKHLHQRWTFWFCTFHFKMCCISYLVDMTLIFFCCFS